MVYRGAFLNTLPTTASRVLHCIIGDKVRWISNTQSIVFQINTIDQSN
jgi:hypothetical protein